MHHPQRQRRIGPGIDRQMLIRQRSRARLVRIDHNQLRAVTPRLFNKWPQMHIVAMDIRAPRDDQSGMGKVLRRRPQLYPIDTLQRRSARLGADRPSQLRSSQPMKEPAVHRPISQLADRPGVAVRQHALRSKLRRNLLQLRRNLVERLVPRDSLKRLGLMPLRQRPLRHACPPSHRIQQPIRRIHPVQILRHLSAQKSPRHRMRRIALHLHRAAR